MLLKVMIVPNSKKSKIVKGDVWKVYVRSPPINGRANKELVSILKKEFKKPVRLVKGFRSREKVVEVLS